MRKYKKNGKGILGFIDRHKKEVGGIVAVSIVIAGYCIAARCIVEAEMSKEEAETEAISPTYIERVYYNVPIQEEVQDVIIEECDAYGIDPTIVIAIIETESNYNENAVGDNGNSQGLMQIWESYHTDRMERLGASDLYDPKDNVRTGIDIIGEKIEKYGEIEKALIAYNAGDAGAQRYYFSKGIFSNKYSQGVIQIASEIKTK